MIRFAFVGSLWAIATTAAPAQSRPDYEAYGQGRFLRYLDAAPDKPEIRKPPRLLASFGGDPFPIVMDTGSTGVVVSAERIPNVDTLPSRPGRLTYTSSGRVMIGRWVTVSLSLAGQDGASIETAPIPVLAVARIECTAQARTCEPEDKPEHVSMLGVGFGREGDRQSESTPDTNPFLNLAVRSEHSVRRGYVVTPTGVHVGLTRANTRGDFRFVKLEPDPGIAGEWRGAPVCITLDDGPQPFCGSSLVDTGVDAMYLTLPGLQAGTSSGPAEFSPGARLTFSFPGGAARTAASYGFTVGAGEDAMTPAGVHLNTTRPTPFVNTGVRFLNGFDVLYDADGGYIAYRPRQVGQEVRP